MKFRLKLSALLAIALTLSAAGRTPCNTRHGLWLWAGISTSELESYPGDTFYLHQGSVIESRAPDKSPPKYHRMGISPHTLPPNHGVYLVYRLDSLIAHGEIVRAFSRDAFQWARSGNTVLGLQLDFDSPTRGLGKYIDYLEQLRKELPSGYRLSVTGLADWPATGDRAEIERIAAATDEIIFQLYAGRSPVENLNLYLKKFEKLSVRFKLGLLNSMDSCSAMYEGVRANPYFEGFVYFQTATANENSK